MIDTDLLQRVQRDRALELCQIFFPLGKREGGEWKIGNISGSPGGSLGIQVVGPKAGLWKDRATDHGGDIVKLICLNRNLDFALAAEEIGRAIGLDLTSRPVPATVKTADLPYKLTKEEALKCTNSAKRLLDSSKAIESIAAKREWNPKTIRDLAVEGSLGLTENNELAFLYETGIKFRGQDNDGNRKFRWSFGKNWLWRGGFIQQAKTIWICEGETDAITLIDEGHESDGLVISLPGSSFKIDEWKFLFAGKEVVLCPDNDEAGRKCLNYLIGVLWPIAQSVKFLDWSVFEGNPKDVSDARKIRHATRIAPPPLEKIQEEESGDLNPPWIDCLSLACCTSEQLQKLEIEPRKPYLGDWLREGDLGFIFAGRGIGKTWLAIDLARGLAGGLNVGPWESHGVFPALYLDGEMPPEDVKQRDISLGQGTGHLTYINHDILFQRTGRVMNLADPLLQEAILHLCVETGKKVLFLDNLSTLVAGAQENDGKDWEILQPWLLRLRRQKITVVFIHHAGRNNMMRGHSKREDTCFWIIRLDKKASVNDELGAVFLSTFTKWRNSKREPSTYEWHYQPNGDKTQVTYKPADKLDVLRQQIEDGLDSATEIAEEMGVSKGYVSKLATKAERQGWLRKIKGGKYQIVEDWER